MPEVKHEKPEWEAGRLHSRYDEETYRERTIPDLRMTLKHKLSVAPKPGAYFITSRGVRRKQGERVDFPEDFGPYVGDKASAVSSGALIELTSDQWQINNGKATRVVLRPHPAGQGIADIGSIPKPQHYAKPAQPARQVVRNGAVYPEEAKPEINGEAEIARLVKQKFIGEFKNQQAVKKAIEQARRDHAERVQARLRPKVEGL